MSHWQPTRFYRIQAILLVVTAIVLLWAFYGNALDLQLEARYYDPASQGFPWRHAWVTEILVHRDLTGVLIACGVGVWLLALAMKFCHWVPRSLRGHQRRWWLLAWSLLAVPLLIDSLRHFSIMHCPWDIAGLGGTAPYVGLLSRTTAGVHPGHCFPAAAVTSGSWLLAFALLWYPERKLRSALLAAMTLAIAFGIGWVQQMRGAHFLSHTLWSLWISWAVIVLLHRVSGAGREAAG